MYVKHVQVPATLQEQGVPSHSLGPLPSVIKISNELSL